MKNLLMSSWTGFLSSIAAGVVSSAVTYQYGQTSINSLGFGLIIVLLVLTLFYFYSRSTNAAEKVDNSKGVNINNSQNINAGTITDSYIINSDKITLNKK